MSGIAGLVGLDGRRLGEGDVRPMVEAMRHRGPDRLGAWSEGSTGLGHAMLETTPESLAESLPQAAGPFAITADARIDNRDDLLRQLRPDLAALGLEADVIPDSSLIVAAYARWGTECVTRLLGDFAFAIWDTREQALFCARDPLGVRPVYYTHQPGALFAIASEPKALFAVDGVAPRIDEARVAESLSVRIYDPVATPFAGVVKIPAAHTLTVGAQGVSLSRYWTLEPQADAGPDYAEGFADVFTEAVRCRIRSAFPVGAELSGGLDSSAVTAVAAREMAGRPLHTISLAYSDPRTDERRFGQAILDRLGGQAVDHYVHPERERILSLYTEIFEILDDLRVRGNGYGNYLTAREAGRQGVRVLLTGQDGDTSVGHGWEWFSEQAMAGAWDRVRSESERVFDRCRADQDEHDSQFSYQRSTQIASAYVAPLLQYWAEEKAYLSFARASRALRRHFGAPLWGPARQYGLQLVMPGALRRRRALRITADTARKRIPATLDPGLVARTGVVDRLTRQIRTEAARARGRFTAFDAQLRTLTSEVVEGNLHKLDLYASASGVEVRHPFMDVRLLAYCLAVPSGAKLRDGYTRHVMREALRDDLPGLVRDRMNKMDHGAQQSRFIFASEPDRVEALLGDPGDGARYLDLPVVRDLWRRGVVDATSLTEWEVASLSAAITTLLWFQVSPLAPEAVAANA
ncbi:MAG: lasso peptide isopeptide bond-forming cyclase [Bacteroidota bacterium]